MARKRAHNEDGTFTPDNTATPTVDEAWVETPQEEQPAPADISVQTPSTEPTQAAPAPVKELIETDVRKKLSARSEDENVFIPTSPAVLEAATKTVAEQDGFDLNRGTSIGARLIARSRKMV